MFELLLIEDEPLQAKLLQLQVQAVNKEVEAAKQFNLVITRDGSEARDYLIKSLINREIIRPDLILLDIQMPRMNGLQFLEWLRQESDFRLRIIPVIVLTSSRNEEEVLRAYKQQIAAFIPKPGNVAALRDVVDAMQQLWVQYSLKLPLEG